MFEKFGKYMYYLLSAPFKQIRKEKNQWYIYFRVIGQLFDENKRMLQRAREESMVQTASTILLPEHGLDRSLSRYEGETWENFRIRLTMYADTCLLGGTELGTLQAVKSLGFSNVRMVPCFKMDGNRDRWAEFFVIIIRDVDDEFDIGHEIIRREVRKVKKVSGKDNYRFVYQIGDGQTESLGCFHRTVIRSEAYWYNNNIFNGLWPNDGSIDHNNVVSNHAPYIQIRSSVEHKELVTVQCTTKHHWRIHDGSTRNDGSKKFDAAIIREEI